MTFSVDLIPPIDPIKTLEWGHIYNWKKISCPYKALKGDDVKKIILLIIVFMALQNVALADENLLQIDHTLEFAFEHARTYPPEFESELQKANLKKELVIAISQLEEMLSKSDQSQEILLRLGKANTFAYNLDISESKEKADKYFAQLFKLSSKHRDGHLFYGHHLSERGEFENAVSHLQIAADEGEDRALYMIGLAYIQFGKADKAKEYLLKFQKKYPGNPDVKILLESFDPNGKYQYKLMKE